MKVRLNNVRISFADGLWRARAQEEGQTPKFGSDFLLTEGHSIQKQVVNADGSKTWVPTKMSAVLKEVAEETWKGKGEQMLGSLENSKKCLRHGDTRLTKGGDIYDGYEGIYYVSAKNKARPDVRDAAKRVLTEADGKPYSGCYVNAIVDVYGMSDPKRKGVHASLQGVQFLRDGDSFGGGGVASEDDYDDCSAPQGQTADDLV